MLDNPADEGSSNYQGFRTENKTQIVTLLNALDMSNGEETIAVLSILK